VYVVALTQRADRVGGAVEACPLSSTALDELLAVRPELRLDGTRPSRRALAQRLSEMWLGDESILYVGLAGTSLRTRVGQYYATPLGARKPHAGGWPLKTLSLLTQLFVHYAGCTDPAAAEQKMLDTFKRQVSTASLSMLRDPSMPIPFANLEARKGARKAHGITGAREPSAVEPRSRRRLGSTHAIQQASEPAEETLRTRPRMQPAGPLQSQRMTDSDIGAGRIRFPSSAKQAFPGDRGTIHVELRGLRLTARWDPRYGPDRERSGVLNVGREALAARVVRDEVLAVQQDGHVVILT
jgi:hypothetical protein